MIIHFLAAVDPRDASKTYARCGHVREDLTLGDRAYVCPTCRWTADRDYNAALNILARTGRGPPAVPVELRPLQLPTEWQGGAMSWEAPRLQPRSSSQCTGQGSAGEPSEVVLRWAMGAAARRPRGATLS
ncbi:MAG: zinc ribbon domain-containing protein, partial [Conexivisphaera sp.]